MQEPLAKIEHLQLKYKAISAVKDVSFELHKGEILAIIGPNGSGKTSTVECLEGLRIPSAGIVNILGVTPHQHRQQLYKEMGIQLQDIDYPDNIRVNELCRLFASFYSDPVDWTLLLERFGLKEKATRYVKKLSGGEKQRLSILLALLPHPKLLILDELTTGLDPEVRRGMWESLKQIRDSGTTILLVSHYMDEVEYLADRLVYLADGRSVFVGTTEGFKHYVKEHTSYADWNDAFSLEDAFLLISPKTDMFQLEDLL